MKFLLRRRTRNVNIPYLVGRGTRLLADSVDDSWDEPGRFGYKYPSIHGAKQAISIEPMHLPSETRFVGGRLRRRGFTILEVMLAASIMALALSSAVLVMQRALSLQDAARNITLAGQVIQAEFERMRLKDWSVVSGYAAGSSPVTVSNLFANTSNVGGRFSLQRTVSTPQADLREIVLTASWRTYDGRTVSRSMKTYYGRFGLYDYYYNHSDGGAGSSGGGTSGNGNDGNGSNGNGGNSGGSSGGNGNGHGNGGGNHNGSGHGHGQGSGNHGGGDHNGHGNGNGHQHGNGSGNSHGNGGGSHNGDGNGQGHGQGHGNQDGHGDGNHNGHGNSGGNGGGDHNGGQGNDHGQGHGNSGGNGHGNGNHNGHGSGNSGNNSGNGNHGGGGQQNHNGE